MVSRILRWLKLNRMRDLEPAPVVQRYEYAAPGDQLKAGHQAAGADRQTQPSRDRQLS